MSRETEFEWSKRQVAEQRTLKARAEATIEARLKEKEREEKLWFEITNQEIESLEKGDEYHKNLGKEITSDVQSIINILREEGITR